MIVRHNIGPVKIGGTMSRLSVGHPVPADVLKHWQKSGQLDALISSGAVEDETRTVLATKAPRPIKQGTQEIKSEELEEDDGLVCKSEG
jgi:hypothetical protein